MGLSNFFKSVFTKEGRNLRKERRQAAKQAKEQRYFDEIAEAKKQKTQKEILNSIQSEQTKEIMTLGTLRPILYKNPQYLNYALEQTLKHVRESNGIVMHLNSKGRLFNQIALMYPQKGLDFVKQIVSGQHSFIKNTSRNAVSFTKTIADCLKTEPALINEENFDVAVAMCLDKDADVAAQGIALVDYAAHEKPEVANTVLKNMAQDDYLDRVEPFIKSPREESEFKTSELIAAFDLCKAVIGTSVLDVKPATTSEQFKHEEKIREYWENTYEIEKGFRPYDHLEKYVLQTKQNAAVTFKKIGHDLQ